MQAMVKLYCQKKHGTSDELCPHCQDFLDYALNRLSRCPYQEKKPVCAQCKTHCYKPFYKEEARKIMRFAGPRLLLTHPILVLKHLYYERTIKAPEKPRNPNARKRE